MPLLAGVMAPMDDPANDLEVTTLGLNWRPLSNLVFKAEYQDHEESADGWNVAMGFSF